MPDLPVFPGIPGPAADGGGVAAQSLADDGGDAGAQGATGQDTTGQDTTGQDTTGDRTSGPGPDATGPDHGRRRTGGGGRVIRPASYLRFTFLPDAGAARADNGEAADDQAGDSTPGQGASQAAGRSPAPSGYHAEEPYLDYLDYLDAEDAADRYVPPPPPQLPRPDMVARAAWAGLFGGPGFLFLATLLSWNVPGWAELAAIMAFVAGFAIVFVSFGALFGGLGSALRTHQRGLEIGFGAITITALPVRGLVGTPARVTVTVDPSDNSRRVDLQYDTGIR